MTLSTTKPEKGWVGFTNLHGRWQTLGVLGPSLQAPYAELIRPTRISGLCAPFPRPKKRRDSTSPRECRAGRVPLFSRSSLRVAVTLWEALAPAGLLASAILQSFALTPKITMAHQSKSGTTQFALDISPDARLRRWDLGRKLKPSRPFSTSSRPRTKSILLRSSAWKRKSITPFTSSNP